MDIKTKPDFSAKEFYVSLILTLSRLRALFYLKTSTFALKYTDVYKINTSLTRIIKQVRQNYEKKIILNGDFMSSIFARPGFEPSTLCPSSFGQADFPPFWKCLAQLALSQLPLASESQADA